MPVKPMFFKNPYDAPANLRGFVVEDRYLSSTQSDINGYPLLGTLDWLIDNRKEVVCCCTIGNPNARAHIQEELEKKECIFETLISPDVKIHQTTFVENGIIIQSGCRISVNIIIKKGALLNGEITIGHDTNIGAYSCVMPRSSLLGNVRIGKQAMIGCGSILIPGLTIEDEAIVAPGSVVYRRVKKGKHVLGNPAKYIDL